MSNVEFLFAASFYTADKVARKQGWVPRRRPEWHKPDGTAVGFIFLEEELALVPPDVTVYVVGNAPAGYERKMVKLAA